MHALGADDREHRYKRFLTELSDAQKPLFGSRQGFFVIIWLHKGGVMKFGLSILAALMLSSCATTSGVTHRDVSPVQTYRFEGDKDSTPIAGWVERIGNSWEYKAALLTVQIGNDRVIENQPLNKLDYTGDVVGGLYHGKQVSASCNSKRTTKDWLDVRCLIFVGNERTVTLTF